MNLVVDFLMKICIKTELVEVIFLVSHIRRENLVPGPSCTYPAPALGSFFPPWSLLHGIRDQDLGTI